MRTTVNLTVSVPADLKSWLEEQAANREGPAVTLSSYVTHILNRHRKICEENPAPT